MKRTNEFVFTSMRRVFVRFLGESSARKKRFEIYWPLASLKIILEWSWPAILNLNSSFGQLTLTAKVKNGEWPEILDLKSINLNLILFWNPAQKYFLMTRSLSLGQPFRSNGLWPTILNLKLVNLNLVLFCNPAQKWFSEIRIKNSFGMTGNLELEFTNIGQCPIFLNGSNSLWQAPLNLISVNLDLILFWNPAEKWFWRGILEILNSSAYDRPVNLHYFVETDTRVNS